MQRLSDLLAFLREFRQSFETTGAILPSGLALAKVIAQPPPAAGPLQWCEAGPGTGAFTETIIGHLQPGDRLTVVEINPRFANILRDKLQSLPTWRSKQDQIDLIEGSVANLPAEARYDAIVCGIPFNNLPPTLVDELIGGMLARLAPTGTLRYFEYLYIRRLKTAIAAGAKRKNLHDLNAVLNKHLDPYAIAHQSVWRNVPPAVVHVLRSPTAPPT